MDHRTRSGQQRREKTARRLHAAALAVFAERGLEACVIDEVIQRAGVARGTFYYYYPSTQALVAALADAISQEIMQLIDPQLQPLRDPAARVATGVRLALQLVAANRQLATFLVRGGPTVVGANPLVRDYLPRDLADGLASGRFTLGSVELGFDLVLGAVLMAFGRISLGPLPSEHDQQLAQALLLALGLNQTDAALLAVQPLPELVPAEGSLLRCG